MMASFVSREAEQSVLGALLIDPAAWDAVQPLGAQDFGHEQHATIFRAIDRLQRARRPADVITVFEAIRAQGDPEEAGGLEYLNALAQAVPSGRNARRYAEVVIERAALRRARDRLEEAQALLSEPGETPEKLERIAALVQGLDSSNARRKPRHIASVLQDVVDVVDRTQTGEDPAWATGLCDLDGHMNGGLRPGKLVLLAARPGVGKSSLSMQIAKRMAEGGRPTLALSQEMESVEVAQRLVANAGRVDYGRLQRHRGMDDESWARATTAIDGLSELPLWIDDEPAQSMRAMAAKARQIKGLKVLVVDYLQLCVGEGDNRTQAVGSVSRGLKALAKEMGICIIALSQLNRAVEQRPDRRPVLADLRDSGEIEQDADSIIFLWPLSVDDASGLAQIGCEVAKNRQGKRGAFALGFDGSTQLWVASDCGIGGGRAAPEPRRRGFSG